MTASNLSHCIIRSILALRHFCGGVNGVGGELNHHVIRGIRQYCASISRRSHIQLINLSIHHSDACMDQENYCVFSRSRLGAGSMLFRGGGNLAHELTTEILRRLTPKVLGQALTLISEGGPSFVCRALSEESWHSQDFRCQPPY